MSILQLSAGRLFGLASLLVLLLPPSPVHASQELRETLAALAADIKKGLAGEGETTIAVGQFGGPTTFPTSSGPGVREVLTEELQKAGITVKEVAKFGIKGSYSVTEVPAVDPADARIGKKVLAVKLKASLVDKFDNPVGNLNFDQVIRGEATFFELIPVTVALPPKAREVDRDRELRKAFVDPSTPGIGTVVRSHAKSPYGIELLVDDKSREIIAKDGLAFIPIKRGEVYAVRLINDSEFEAAVQLRIDGLSMFAFSELRHTDGKQKGEPRYTVVIVPAKTKTVVIPGWHVTNTKSDRFVVTEYAKSASAGLKPTAELGTVSATFQAAWEKGKAAPSDEPGKDRSPGTGDATGRGPRIEKEYREVEREFGIIRDIVSVRYTTKKDDKRDK